MHHPIHPESTAPLDTAIPVPTTPAGDLARAIAPTPRPRRRRAAGVVVGAITTGLLATVSLPAYAYAPSAPGGEAGAAAPASALAALTRIAAQELAPSPEAVVAADAGEDYAVVTGDSIRAAQAAQAAAEAAAQAAAAQAAADAAAAEAAANAVQAAASVNAPVTFAAPTTGYSLDAVFQTGLQYQGVPYVFGGETPAGFDCSGFVKYVFGQLGIGMPHSVTGQAAMGTPISIDQAQPGDLIIMDGHDGIYAGNGSILHAPYPGASVRVQPLWTSAYSVVRING